MILVIMCLLIPDTLVGNLNIELKRGTPPQIEVLNPDTTRVDLKLNKAIPTLLPQMGKASEVKENKISYHDLMYYAISQRTLIKARNEVKNAIKDGKSDGEIMLIKLRMERDMLNQKLEFSKLEGKKEEMQKLQRQIQRLNEEIKLVEETLK